MPTRASSLQNSTLTGLTREIGSQYDNVKAVAENIESVVTVADHIDNVDTVVTNIVDVHAVGGSIVDVRTVAANINNVVTVVQDIANINVVAANADNIDMIVTEVLPNIDEIANASANAAIATTKASEASASATSASSSATSASNSAIIATDQATIATTKASEAAASATSASNSATSASGSASTATTKASEALASQVAAAASASTASTKASEANTSAGNAASSASTASTQAGIATTKATEASNSASAAATSASTATTKADSATASASAASASATLAYTKAAEADADATSAANSATSASNSATSASSSANTATTKANEASASATSASNSATSSSNSASSAASNASSAAASATNAQTSANNAQSYMNSASSSATNAQTAAATATAKAELAQAVVIPTGATYSLTQLDTRNTIMSKAAFNALAAERRANRAGSGFDEWGKHYSDTNNYPKVNEGIWTWPTSPNLFVIGDSISPSTTAISKTNEPLPIVNGVLHKMSAINHSTAQSRITLPPAPTVLPYDAVLTTEQIAMGVIKHADASNSGLIVNGKFDTDTSGWTASNATLSSVNGELNIALLANDGGAYKALPTITGKTYIVEIDVISKDFFTNIWIANTPGMPYLTKALAIGKNKFEFTATATTTYLQIHCGTTAGTFKFDNVAVFPADAISRSDLVFLETWHEDVSEKDFVYPLGNVQYLGGVTDGMGAIVSGSFSGSSTYSLFGNWQASGALVGKGYVWSGMSDAQKKAFVSNPENNCYLDGDKVIQVRYRMRVVAGMGDSWANVTTATTTYLTYANTGSSFVSAKGKAVDVTDYRVGNTNVYLPTLNTSSIIKENGVFEILSTAGATFSYNGQVFALPIALVHRRNSGIAHSVFNSNGTKLASDSLPWYSTTVSFTSIADCFDSSKLLTASGYIGTTSGRPNGLFYDQVHESDITDLRMSSQKVEDYNRLIDREFNKLVTGTYRGSEGEWQIVLTQSLTCDSVAYMSALGTGTTYVQDNGNNLNINYGSISYIDNNLLVYIQGNSKWYLGVQVASGTNSFVRLHPMHGSTAISDFTVGNSYTFIVATKSTRTKSNTLTHCDIIGSPANYPTSWKQSGVSGVPLIVAEDGTSLLPTGSLTAFKLSRKANATPLQVLKSTDSGATWTALAVTTDYTFSTASNVLTMVVAPATTDLVMVTYQTHTNMAVAGVNAEVLGVGNSYSSGSNAANYGNSLHGSLTGNVGVMTSSSQWSWSPTAYSFYGIGQLISDAGFGYCQNTQRLTSINQTSCMFKTFPYLTRSNGKARLQLVFKEMKYSTANADWGDDSTFNIVDNVSTTTDWYGAMVLVGQKYVELPYFIGSGE